VRESHKASICVQETQPPMLFMQGKIKIEYVFLNIFSVITTLSQW